MFDAVKGYQLRDANDPGHAPAYLMIGAIIFGGFLFLLALPLALIGAYIGYRAKSGGKTPPNAAAADR